VCVCFPGGANLALGDGGGRLLLAEALNGLSGRHADCDVVLWRGKIAAFVGRRLAVVDGVWRESRFFSVTLNVCVGWSAQGFDWRRARDMELCAWWGCILDPPAVLGGCRAGKVG
jgi:hypothetical protein